jgi:uncharacterized membrane protein
LLDDNIFGKDWVKSAILSTFVLAIFAGIIGASIYLSIAFIAPFLASVITDASILFAANVLLVILNVLVVFIPLGPVMVGMSAVHLDLVRGSGAIKITKFFNGFSEVVDNFQIGFMYALHIIVWGFLFIIPGILVGYSYSMAFYVKRDNPEYTWRECFDESERIMEGNRWRLFKLHCNFIGWYLVGILAFLGVGLLWVAPYVSVSTAVFYEEAKNSKD